MKFLGFCIVGQKCHSLTMLYIINFLRCKISISFIGVISFRDQELQWLCLILWVIMYHGSGYFCWDSYGLGMRWVIGLWIKGYRNPLLFQLDAIEGVRIRDYMSLQIPRVLLVVNGIWVIEIKDGRGQGVLVSYNDRRPNDLDMIGGSHDGVPGLLLLLSLEIFFPKLWSLGDRMDHQMQYF